MGFIKAFVGAIGGSFADSWKDFYVPSRGSATVGVFPAVLQGKNAGRGSNTKGSKGVITNGSKIIVPEGTALITLQDGEITGFISEPGGYVYQSDDLEAKSFLSGDGFINSTVKQSWERFKFGGRPTSEQTAFYVNLKEIPNNRFGTQSSIYWDDAFLGSQAGAIVRGTYTLKIEDPILFIKNFVPAMYLQPDSYAFDFGDMDNEAGAQLFNEVVGSLSAAFSLYTNDPSRGNRITRIQGDQAGFAATLAQVIEQNYSWRGDRGLAIIKTAIISIEYDAATREIMEEARKADALMGARGNSFMQQSVARGIQAAGEKGGAGGMAYMGFGMGMAGNAAGAFTQPVDPYAQNQNQNNQNQNNQNQNNQSNPPEEDPFEKLSKLKQMLDAGLITQEDYDKAKNKILGL